MAQIEDKPFANSRTLSTRNENKMTDIWVRRLSEIAVPA